jgi:hypothetical protein
MRGVALVLVMAACGHHSAEDKPVAAIDGDVTALGADDSSLYVGVMQLGKPSIVRIAKTGGAPETMVAKPGVVKGIVAGGGTLAWAETYVESDGSGATVITADEIAKAGGIAEAVSANTDHPARIMTVPLAGGTPTQVVKLDAVPVGFGADDKDFYLLSLGQWPRGGDIDPTLGSIIVVPRAGGAPHLLVDHLNRASELTVGPNDVGWSTNHERWKVAKAAGRPQRDGTSTANPLTVELVDGATTYVAKQAGDRTTIVAHTR